MIKATYYTRIARKMRGMSKIICRDSKCTKEYHNCNSFAYFTTGGYFIEICRPENFSGTEAIRICLPCTFTAKQLKREISLRKLELKKNKL